MAVGDRAPAGTLAPGEKGPQCSDDNGTSHRIGLREMLRALLYGLAILHLGPGIAFAVLAFGCDPSQPFLGALCRKDTIGAFMSLTLAFWIVLGVGAVALVALRRRSGEGATDAAAGPGALPGPQRASEERRTP